VLRDDHHPLPLLICRQLLFCERLTTDDRGRINFLGVFNQLNGEQFPLRHGPFVAAFELATLRRPVIRELLVIGLTVTLDGRPVGVFSKTMEDVTIEVGRSLSTDLDLSPLVFDEPGDYRIQLTVNGCVVATRPLAVCLVGERTG
jgi:hypothetical protein